MSQFRTVRALAALLAIPALVVACTGGGAASPLPTIPPATPTPTVAPESPHPTSGIPATCPKEQPAALPGGETRTAHDAPAVREPYRSCIDHRRRSDPNGIIGRA